MTVLANKNKQWLLKAGVLFSPFMFSPVAFATNGMLLEGMGPEATGMGGAAQAVDNGTAAMVNNPATLGLMRSGESRFDFAVGNLRPDVEAGQMGSSDGDSYLMPAIGYTSKTGRVGYGVGVFSQGGMGTEYGSDTMLGMFAGGEARSEVGVGAVLFPVSYDLSSKVTVGGTLQYVWGGMDMIFGMPMGNTAAPQPGTFADFANPSSNILGSATGTLVQGLGSAAAPAFLSPDDAAVFHFSNDNDFSGQVKGQGAGASAGIMYQASPRFRVGGSYRTKTAMSNFKGSGSMKIIDLGDGAGGAGSGDELEITGDYSIKDFQFPAVASVGMAYQVTPSTLLAMDVSHIDWSSVMDTVDIVFKADSGPFAGAVANVSMNQHWDDQTVVKLGVEHALNARTKIRGGLNIASNPVPDEYLNPLFPAIIENHITAGFSHKLNRNSEISGSIVHAPEVEQTNSNTMGESSHSQTNLQLMYSRTW
ncbi:OmpP1/FadL family transporter [Leucothrix pacifica]|uniref:Aromatic hydrocarbon degradation protein n=1 Tax=Leucothrix pacifica TaxID=1247513 RepID=A0A317CDE0_9GAMM|nr:outer membrane protein transport protein [Leucothrix pacifica]PWQ94330.1 hypothetical protein DKW60_16975 [Leucothrix pacifica]